MARCRFATRRPCLADALADLQSPAQADGACQQALRLAAERLCLNSDPLHKHCAALLPQAQQELREAEDKLAAQQQQARAQRAALDEALRAGESKLTEVQTTLQQQQEELEVGLVHELQARCRLQTTLQQRQEELKVGRLHELQARCRCRPQRGQACTSKPASCNI